MQKQYNLSVTTQGPLYPPSEICDEHGNFIVIGYINDDGDDGVETFWGGAIVSQESPLPDFSKNLPYTIVRRFEIDDLENESESILYTLPLPLPCNNYRMLFAPEQRPDAHNVNRTSLPLHKAVPDYLPEHSRQNSEPVTLGVWVKARGVLNVKLQPNKKDAEFSFHFKNLIPKSLYTIMALRELDLAEDHPTRPGPLGIPNCFITDTYGSASYSVIMNNPFPVPGTENCNRIINVVVLFMSSQCSYGGAIGCFGLGGDIHAQLKLSESSFHEFSTYN